MLNTELLYAKTTGSISINGASVEYEAVSEEIPLTNENGETDATIFMVSYSRLGVEQSGRPLLFAFNGGPGSASVFLHIGGLGPKIIDFGDGTSMPFDPPFNMHDNEGCLLDICDLVFVDPVGCGYSRVLTPEAERKYASSQQDAKSVLLAIDQFLHRHKRWNCPLYILGESYGTVRAALMAQQLYENSIGEGCNALNIHASGVILVGSLLDRDKSLFPVERTVTNFPAVAAAHWYHMEGEKPPLPEVIAAAEDFAMRQYLPLLGLGCKASSQERQAVVDGLMRFSGLSRSSIERHGLRVTVDAYVREVCLEKSVLISQYDSRFTSRPTAMDTYDFESDDPCFQRLMPAFTHSFYGTLKSSLGLDTQRDYQFSNLRMSQIWEFDAPRNPVHSLEDAMRRSKSLRVLFANGYFDMLTTYSYSDYMCSNFELPAERVWLRGYEGGHMLYLGRQQANAFQQDIRSFITCAAQRN